MSDSSKSIFQPNPIQNSRTNRRRSKPLLPDASQHTVSDPYRCPEFWFKDGTVVLLANSFAFKVHQGVLSRHSTVFQALLDPPGFMGLERDRDGCPVLRLTDQPEHVWLLLTLLYDGALSPFFTDPMSAIDFRDVRGLALLSCKYVIGHIKAECFRRLRVFFPSDLSGWDNCYTYIWTFPPQPMSKALRVVRQRKTSVLLLEDVDAIAVVNLAQKYRALDILPASLSLCSQLALGDLSLSVCYADDDYEALSPADLQRCLTFVGTHPSSKSICTLDTFEHATGNACLNHGQGPSNPCLLAWGRSYGQLQVAIGQMPYDNLATFVDGYEALSEDPDYALCKRCRASLNTIFPNRLVTWDRLCTSFELT